ncbi:hypothetical protein BDR26DRAFT_914378 [Obelidium mucronatum]|nr:hypothetical protein BDR26DRAFT_914378 [Obelidium mucronatum]
MAVYLFRLILSFLFIASSTLAFKRYEEHGRVGNVYQTRTCLNPSGKIYPDGAMYSPNGQYALVMQGDGNLVLHTVHCGPTSCDEFACDIDYACDEWADWDVVWSSNSYGTDPYWFEYSQYTGNLEIWAKNPTRLSWSVGTAQKTGEFCLHNDGNLYVNNAQGRSVWSSNTSRQ